MRNMMSKLKLTVNETKTRSVSRAGGDVRLPGLHVRPVLLAEDGAVPTSGTYPSAKKIERICDAISEVTDRTLTLAGRRGRVVAQLNQMLLGWANYFCLGPVSQAYRAVDRHACHRLRQWLCGKHKVQEPGADHGSPTSTCTRSWAWSASVSGRATSRGRKHESLSESRMREIRPSGSMSGEWKRSMVRASEAPADERAGNRIGRPKPPRHSSTLQTGICPLDSEKATFR